MKIRIIKKVLKAKALQVVRYQNNTRIVLQHIGSSNKKEFLNDLMILAEEWIYKQICAIQDMIKLDDLQTRPIFHFKEQPIKHLLYGTCDIRAY